MVDGVFELDENVCLKKIVEVFQVVKVDIVEFEKQMKKFFGVE